MAAKRAFDDSDENQDNPNDNKRIRPTTPSFASVIGRTVMVQNMQNLFASALEPLLKRVVKEEVERVMRQYFPCSITRSPSLRIQAQEQPSNLQLSFNKRLSLPIFTSSRILDINGNPINIILVDKTNTNQVISTSLPYPIKLEIVILNGDFPPNGNEDWTNEEFNRHILKERIGKRPLLAGELNLTLRNGIAPIGDIEFTDNSSWIRSRKFRIGVRIIPRSNQYVKIREGITEAFVVKDHRGELYKKHHPPTLHDEVWRLEKIGKEGAFHRKLSAEGIKTVQDFLKLAVINIVKLRKILGIGMSDKMWEVTIKHAMTCDMGSKIYIYSGSQFTIYLNPICKLIKADINGQIFSSGELNHMNKGYIDKLVKEAYARWNNLEEIDEVLNDNIALLTQGDQIVEQFPNNHQASIVRTYHQKDHYGEKSTKIDSYLPSNNAQMGSCEWSLSPDYGISSFANVFPYGISSGLQLEGNIPPSGSGTRDINRGKDPLQ